MRLILFLPSCILPRLFFKAFKIRRTFCFPPSQRNLLRLASLEALKYLPGYVIVIWWSLWSSFCTTGTVGRGGAEMSPFFTSLPASRAVCSIHSPIMLMVPLALFPELCWIGVLAEGGLGIRHALAMKGEDTVLLP